MGWAVFKQPDGTFAVWSTVVDDWIFTEGTEGEIRRELVMERGEDYAEKLMAWAKGEVLLPPLYPIPTHAPGERKPPHEQELDDATSEGEGA